MLLYGLLIFLWKYKNKIRIRRKLDYFKKYDVDKYKVVVNSYKEYFLMCNRQKWLKKYICLVYQTKSSKKAILFNVQNKIGLNIRYNSKKVWKYLIFLEL